MGNLINLLNAQAKLYDGPPRQMDPTFGVSYFDGTRDTGYGGYKYDGRWKPIAQAVIERYNLKSGDRVLDLGCAKGFFLADMMNVCPGIQVTGIEVSEYALSNALESVKPFLRFGSADNLRQFKDHSFDFVAAMNTLHFLNPADAETALRDIMRVGKGKYFVQVDAFANDIEKERLLAWAPIIKTVYSVDQWLELFQRVGYDGDYFWTFVRPLTTPELTQSASRL